MGRGRAKAKQTKVARDLTYSSYEPNYKALEQELTTGGHRSDVVTEQRAVPDLPGPADEYVDWAAEER